MFRRFQSAAAVFYLLPAIALANSGLIQVTGVRSWSHADSTRVVLETTGPMEFRTDRAENPDRLFIDVLHARPWVGGRRYATHVVNDALVRRVRIAETSPGTTRVVFDLTGPGTFKVTSLEAPDRLVVEIRPERRAPVTISTAMRPLFVYPPRPFRASVVMAPAAPPLDPSPVTPVLIAVSLPPLGRRPLRPVSIPLVAKVLPPAPKAPPSAIVPRASENATQSLTRALGLKVNRIVIDAGHGGHDDGTIGPNGVLEKDVVLDVALRLSKLVQARMGTEVVLTRADDTFIPLQERTAMANSHKADLFLSIHANSSPAPAVAGTETFFLNFTSSTAALGVAARENAGAEKSVGELKDLVQSITLNDKIAESQTFAETIQNSLFSQAARANVAARNRGVKRAPFVVLIGASMPSVLAEIGFLSNAKDESNLNKADYRQKIAEALYKGLSQYSQSLSHFQVASSGPSGSY